MIAPEILAELKKLEPYTDPEKLRTHLEQVGEVCGEAVRSVIPSVTLGKSGAFLKALFAVTDSYLSEVIVSTEPRKHGRFDFIPLSSIVRFDFKWDDVEVAGSEGESITHKTATIVLLHGNDITSTLEFVGPDRDDWIKSVTKAIPLSIVKQANEGAAG